MGRSSRLKREAHATSPDGESGSASRRSSRWEQHRPIVRFVVRFLGLFVVFQLAYYGVVVPSAGFQSYLGVNSRAAAIVLNLAGENVTASNDRLSSGFSMSIKAGCDGLQAMAILVVALVTFPGDLRGRLAAIAGGIVMVAGLNLLRIVSLFWTGLHFPRWFEPLHVHVWPALLVVAAVSYAVFWAIPAKRSPSVA